MRPRATGEDLEAMRRFTVVSALVLALACAAGPVRAGTPEEVARQSAEAVRAEGITAVTRFIHPDELLAFKEMLAPAMAGDTPVAQGLREAFFGDGTTGAALAAMGPSDFMHGFMAFVETQMAGLDVTIGEQEILGSVAEGEVVHLVTRSTAGAGALQLTQLEVVSLKPYEGTWRLMLSGKFRGMGEALKAQAVSPASP